MNRLKKFHDKKNEKSVSKEVKKANTSPSSKKAMKEGDAMFLKEVESKYKAKKGPSKEKIEKEISTKAKKNAGHQSKRTTPGEIEGKAGATPHVAQTEGERWNKVVTIQNKDRAKTLAQKTTKTTQKERKGYKKAS